jgi:light-regulated signal transduction histidine kinase (bacteriophytochrome)
MWGLVAAIGLFLFLDVMLPRGATAAIGYALVPVLGAAKRRIRFVFVVTVVCTGLTWLGYVVEPPGGVWWSSFFDRVMVSLVLWLTFLLVARRIVLMSRLDDAVAELHRSNQELERFASVAAHDMRGPLTAISLLTQLITREEQGRLSENTEKSLTDIQQQVKSMGQFVERLLVYARVGGAELRVGRCDIEAELGSALRALSGAMESSAASVTHDPLPIIQADSIMIRQLFQNVIENAIKYRGEEPPKIHLSARPDGSDWIIEVRDNGMGMDKKHLEAVFLPFGQLNRRSGSAGGVGLGLPTCRRIIERHGGRIWVTSRIGEGSTFHIKLPAQGGGGT